MPVIATVACLRTLIHDWNYILGRLGLLQSAEMVGRFLFALGALTMLAGLALLGLDILRCWNAAADPAAGVGERSG